VKLVGEGYFEVSHNPDKPFIVSTSSMDVKALGTKFNVYSYPNAEYVRTILLQGCVCVYALGHENKGTLLHPNQQITYQNGQFKVEKMTDEDNLLWKEGIYSFKKEKLKQIIEKLELYYDVRIVVKNRHLLDYEYTGKFRQCDGVMEILRIIQQIHPFQLKMEEDMNRITIN
jgi:ferric-dicitrate binding protein FerR (iron transport regulator)